MYWSYHDSNTFYNDTIARTSYYFTTISLCFTITLTPIFFYTVVTQSKNLGRYKYFLMHHSLCCLLFEYCLSIAKPVLLSPFPAGFIMGPFGRFTIFMVSVTVAVIFLTQNSFQEKIAVQKPR